MNPRGQACVRVSWGSPVQGESVHAGWGVLMAGKEGAVNGGVWGGGRVNRRVRRGGNANAISSGGSFEGAAPTGAGLTPGVDGPPQPPRGEGGKR